MRPPRSWRSYDWGEMLMAAFLGALVIWVIIWAVENRLPQPHVTCRTITLFDGTNGTECSDNGNIVCSDASGNPCADLSPPP